MFRYAFFLGVLLLLNLQVKASFDFNQNCISAYQKIMQLRLNEARALISKEKNTNPENAITVLLDNYVDYFVLVTTESKADFNKLKANKAPRLSRIEKENRNSPYYLYCQAEINLQWALTRGKFEEFFAAGLEINKAFNMLQQNAKKYPDFLPNQKCLGLVNALLGSLPDGLKRTLGTFGVKGNTDNGIAMLNRLVKVLPQSAYSQYYDEVVFYLSYIQIDILNNYQAYDGIISNTNKIDSLSLLKSYIRAYAGMKTAHNDQAITTLQNRPDGDAYQDYPYMDYLLGIAYMHRLDNSAANYLNRYIKNYKGINFIKDTYLNLAWLGLLSGNSDQYKTYAALVKSKGEDIQEKDKQAIKEVDDAAPDIDLLKARLLFDGGYYAKALNVLDNRKASSFKLNRDKIEYCYRLGRIYDALGKDDSAIKFYQFSLDMGKNERYYFAANSALHIGMIYEQKKDKYKATSFYNQAISMKDHDYQSSIESKAKDGLKRINKG
ncbi:tetratricopeptide repeat protein [Pedobacter sp. HMF7647]|uniref:Tetratricopeptide repeat protein n=1 Tax=Hufsiella arboris TaxID=2695275 RepID=A0A7K1Y6Y0_9SPHI|nr:tetratricopeptide repeat protein [Hufsiella arboris]MXV49808.1 tetratricopeptide repeat protein [Hufsiella arboris]